MKLCTCQRPGTAIAVAIAIAVAASVSGEPRAAETARDSDPGNDFILRNVRVFDGARVLPKAQVLVIDGRIAAVGTSVKAPRGVAEIDGSGKTVLPGLIDAHAHSWGEAQSDALRFGVTAELDMLGDWNRLPELKRQRESLARTQLADLWSAGAAVTAPGGDGPPYGMKVPTLDANGDPAAFVAGRVGEGSDYIKLILEDFSAHSDTRRLPTITAAQAKIAIAAAHKAGKLGVVHVSRLRDGKAAIDAGADGLVHMFGEPGDAAFVAAAKKRKAFVIPTLSVLATMARAGEGEKLVADARLAPWLAKAQTDSLKASFGPGESKPAILADAIANVRALHAAGVDILAGTDAGNPGTTHGASMHGELELLVRAGLTPTEALAAATSVPARRFNLGDRGRIAPGQRADLMMVDGDPTRDILATRAIARVWKNGYAVERTQPKAGATALPVGEALPAGTLVSDFDAELAANARGLLPSTFGAGHRHRGPRRGRRERFGRRARRERRDQARLRVPVVRRDVLPVESADAIGRPVVARRAGVPRARRWPPLSADAVPRFAADAEHAELRSRPGMEGDPRAVERLQRRRSGPRPRHRVHRRTAGWRVRIPHRSRRVEVSRRAAYAASGTLSFSTAANRFFVGATRVATNSRRHGAQMAAERSGRTQLSAQSSGSSASRCLSRLASLPQKNGSRALDFRRQQDERRAGIWHRALDSAPRAARQGKEP